MKCPLKFHAKLKVGIIGILLLTLTHSSLSAQSKIIPAYDSLSSILRKRFGKQFGLSVLIGTENSIQFSEAFGYTDSVNKTPVNTQTLFNIASATKSFTAIGILLLAEKRKLRLNDPIGKFLDAVPPDKQQISIHDLLSHRSGLQQHYVCSGQKTSAGALKMLLADSLAFTPGTRFEYSDENYQLLALIAEKATLMPYENFIRKYILNPLKMKNTCFWDEVSKFNNVAEKKMVLPDSLLLKNWDYIGAGGIYSNTVDLYKFISALINKRLLKKKSLNLLFSEYSKLTGDLGVGYGWFIYNNTKWSTKEIYTRGNEDWGHNAALRWFPDMKIIVIVCTNSGENGSQKMQGNKLVSNFICDFLWN